MYREQSYTGADLPSKTLCLTYDDGPGKHTYDIAKFLFDQNIQATFFVVGKYACSNQDILKKIADLGHLIGNHTYEHPDMPYYFSINGDICNQILRTDAIIKKYIYQDTVYFRSPYGKWSKEVANELNGNILSTINHIGPIHWDVGGIDCYYWSKGNTVEETTEKYLCDINEKDHGIVVMHDDIADMNYLQEKNKTLELTKQLIPLLKKENYKFIRLDEIDAIKRDASKILKFTLKRLNGKYVALSEKGNNSVVVNGKRNNFLNEISMEELGHGKIALKACNNLFFSLTAGKNRAVEAISREVNEMETFDLIPISSNQIALRAYNGHYLTKENKRGGRLVATAAFLRQCEKFYFLPLDYQITKNVSLKERYTLLKRRISYVKSKIQQAI